MTPQQETQHLIGDYARPYGFTVDQITSHACGRRLTMIRHGAFSEVERAKPMLSLPRLGRAFGGRHHTTILGGIRRHQARMAWVDFLRWAAVPVDKTERR